MLESKHRIQSIDLLRGLVMIIMALDHTRDFFHKEAFVDNPLNLATTYPFLFFTRWATHFCAPIFVFLAGLSAYLQGMKKYKKQLSLLLFTRGLWLIFAEIFIITFAITFDVTFGVVIFQVIWAIGISMVLLALLIWLPFKFLFTLGLIIVFGHNIMDGIEANHKEPFGFYWDLLHHGNFGDYHLFDKSRLLIIYPFLPWTGLMVLGYCAGKLYEPQVEIKFRKKTLVGIGVAMIFAFLILRIFNIYGDPVGWSSQKNNLFTFLSFLNVYKYPPSALYFCITIGPALLYLASFENFKNRFAKIIMVYGRVPFLYYVLHFYLLHTISAVFFLMRGHSFAEGVEGVKDAPFKFMMPGEGFDLFGVYVVWILVVIALYPICKYFDNYKSRNRKWWLSYL